jgi:CHAD domain-containing protein
VSSDRTGHKLRLPAGDPAPAAIEALERILAYATRCLADLGRDPETAVHEYRKSVRRARSLMRLLRPSLSRRTRRRLEVPLREAHRNLGGTRDAVILAEIWARLAQITGLEIPAVDATLAARRRPVENRGARRDFSEVIELLRDRLDPDLGISELAAGVAATYRAARRELKRARTVADPAHIHALRRRCKDLNYQLELLRSRGGPGLREARRELRDLARQLGLVTDLYQLRAVLDDIDPGTIAARDRRVLDATIAEAIAVRLEDVLPRADEILGRKPKKLLGRLGL